MKRIMFLLAVCTAGLFQAAWADGMLIPTHVLLPTETRPIMIRPFTVKLQHAVAKIHDGVAETTIEQVFRNDSPIEQEAMYLFPVPEGAAITRLTMTIGDKIYEGKLMGRDEARNLYESIVRRRRDPALLEYAERGLVKLSVYPIPSGAERKITIRYAESLKQEGGAMRYIYPLRVDQMSNKPIASLSATVEIESSAPLQSVFSPSHGDASVRIKNPNHATVTWEASNIHPDRDLVVYYRASHEDLGMSLLTYRSGEDGYFLLFVSPSAKQAAAEMPKHVVFVVDRTGSMTGEKIEQAKAAFKYTIQHLKPQDKFAVIAFNEEPDLFENELVSATPENVKKAMKKVSGLDAQGGTNIKDALSAALKLLKEDDSTGLKTILFLTDGLPTVGETDVKRILSDVKDKNSIRARLFVWGVGEDVNVTFLDKLANQNRGESDFVQQNENIEVKISGFFDMMSSPVLTDMKVFFKGVEALEVYPKELPDLFRGGQVVIAGRYKGSGAGTVVLEGLASNKPRTVRLAANWPDRADSNDYIPRIWAMRKIGFLMDEVRLHNNPEVIQEIVRLAREYGIITEYTSFMIDDRQIEALRDGSFRDDEVATSNMAALRPAPDVSVGAQDQSRASRNYKNAQNAPVQGYGGGNYGALGKIKGESEMAAHKDEINRAVNRVQYARDHTFYFDGSQWTDSRYQSQQQLTNIKRNSDAHFQLIKRMPKMAQYSSVGEEVLVVVGNNAILIGSKGKDKLSEEELEMLVTGKQKHSKSSNNLSVSGISILALGLGAAGWALPHYWHKA